MISEDAVDVVQEAQRQLHREEFDAAVERAKVRLRTRRPWWHKLFPFTVKIERRK